jgi:hypothetical protein
MERLKLLKRMIFPVLISGGVLLAGCASPDPNAPDIMLCKKGSTVEDLTGYARLGVYYSNQIHIQGDDKTDIDKDNHIFYSDTAKRSLLESDPTYFLTFSPNFFNQLTDPGVIKVSVPISGTTENQDVPKMQKGVVYQVLINRADVYRDYDGFGCLLDNAKVTLFSSFLQN